MSPPGSSRLRSAWHCASIMSRAATSSSAAACEGGGWVGSDVPAVFSCRCCCAGPPTLASQLASCCCRSGRRSPSRAACSCAMPLRCCCAAPSMTPTHGRLQGRDRVGYERCGVLLVRMLAGCWGTPRLHTAPAAYAELQLAAALLPARAQSQPVEGSRPASICVAAISSSTANNDGTTGQPPALAARLPTLLLSSWEASRAEKRQKLEIPA